MSTNTNPTSADACPTCGSPPGHCYFICPNSPHYYSPEQERADSEYEDSLSDSQWFSEAVRQYDAIHGPGAYNDAVDPADDPDY